MKRYIFKYIQEDLKSKMVFIGGPRQCGKTYLAKEILRVFKSEKNYFNWDSVEGKKNILSSRWSDQRLIALDEIHKFAKWKSFVKGLYDTEKENHQFLITGSARLDLYKKGGDSMLGRYHYWRLHPFTMDELPIAISKDEAFKRLMDFGGFPEPFLSGSERIARRWRKERTDLIIREDIRDLEKISDIQNISLLVSLLKSRVGSLIVISNLANDLQVAPNTVKRWIEILEKMYLIFIVRPYTEKLSRSIVKPFKVYFYDNADVEGDIGAKYENLVACHLLKRAQFIEDFEGYRMNLAFIRDKEGREVDFVLTKEKQIEFLLEAKWSDEKISNHLIYYSNKLKAKKAIQLVGNLKRDFNSKGIAVYRASDWLSEKIW